MKEIRDHGIRYQWVEYQCWPNSRQDCHNIALVFLAIAFVGCCLDWFSWPGLSGLWCSGSGHSAALCTRC